jgi:hypothetical protein
VERDSELVDFPLDSTDNEEAMNAGKTTPHILLCFFLLSTFIGGGAAFAQEASTTASAPLALSTATVEKDLDLSGGILLIETEPEGAELSINGRAAGESPLRIELKPGSYKVFAAMPGYEPVSAWLDMKRETGLRMNIELRRKNGIFAPIIVPEDAEVLVGGQSVETLPALLPVGTYRLTIRSFGSISFEQTIGIEEGKPWEQRIELEPAAPMISPLKLSRSRINPKTGGPKSYTEIRWELSAPAELKLEIIGPDGRSVEHRRLGKAFRASQEYTWPGDTGASPRLRELRSGTYRIRVQGTFKDGSTLTEETTLLIDGNLKPALFPAPFGRSGSLLCALPPRRAEGLQTGFIPLFFYEEYSSSAKAHFPASLYGVYSRENGRSLALTAGVELAESGNDAAYAGMEAKALLFPSGGTSPLSISAAVSGNYLHSFRRDSFLPATGLSLSFPVRIGGSLLAFALEPKASLLFFADETEEEEAHNEKLPPSSISAAFSSGAAAALLLEAGRLVGALSARLLYDTQQPNEAILRVAAESHLLPTKSVFSVNLFAAADIGAYPQEFSLGGGIGASVTR